SFLLDLGFKKENKVIFYSANTLESLFFELAVFLLGGITIPVNRFSDINKIVASSEDSYYIFSDKPEIIDHIVKDDLLNNRITKGFIVTDEKINIEDKFLNYLNVVKFGFLKRKKLKDTLDEHSKSISQEATATIYYKFDENENPKAQIFSQEKIINLLKVIQKKLKFVTEESQSFSYLPATDSFSRFANILNIQIGNRGAIAANMQDFFDDVREVMPHIVFLTKNQLEIIVKELKYAGESIKEHLGGRSKYIFSDTMPGDGIKTDLVKNGITVIELNQLALVEA
ncbi:MAG: hypothetical protein ACRENO_10060, partial [Thermodesulfobacteriota bacterium]